MNEEEYLNQRLEDQINYYDRASQKNQRYYKRTKMIEIFSASLIPFLAGNMAQSPKIAWLIGLLGLAIAVCEALASLHKFHDNWLQYRAIAEALSKERYLYLTGVRPYNNNGAFRKLVANIEAMLSEENNQWVQTMQQDQSNHHEKEEGQ